jgi:hypothetical protein
MGDRTLSILLEHVLTDRTALRFIKDTTTLVNFFKAVKSLLSPKARHRIIRRYLEICWLNRPRFRSSRRP